MKRIMKKPEIVEELAARTGFYKKNMKEVVEALADIVIEQLQTATFEEVTKNIKSTQNMPIYDEDRYNFLSS